jgi:Zn-dependent peptidase ImmA (M78 family)
VIRRVLDDWRLYAVVAWIVLAGVIVWLFVLNERLNETIDRLDKQTQANTAAIAFLCNTNAILQALTEQSTYLLQTEQVAEGFSQEREVTIEVYRGFIGVMQNRAPCVKAEQAALR